MAGEGNDGLWLSTMVLMVGDGGDDDDDGYDAMAMVDDFDGLW